MDLFCICFFNLSVVVVFGLRIVLYSTLHTVCFPVVLFILSGGWIIGISLLYSLTLPYVMLKLLVVRLIW